MSIHSRRISILGEPHLTMVNITASLAKRIPVPTDVGSLRSISFLWGLFMANLQSERILNKKQLYAIGSVAVESSRLETLIELLIWSICGFDKEQGRIFTDRTQLDGKLAILRELIKDQLKSVKTKAEFKTISDAISNTIPKRNTIIHGEWLGVPKALKKIPEVKSDYPVAIRIKMGRSNIPPIHADEVSRVARSLGDHHEQLIYFWLGHMHELSPSWRKVHARSQPEP
jgi:hypothetical protein